MIFEFINPSDPYHFEAPDLEIATVVTFILGEGKGAADQVGIENEEERLEVPMFLFGGELDWIQATFHKPMDEFLDDVKTNRRQELIKSLESVTIGSLNDYKIYHKTLDLIDDPVKRDQYREMYHDEKRSSVNDFGSYAWKVAKSLKEGAAV
jgi:hypothetical protein